MRDGASAAARPQVFANWGPKASRNVSLDWPLWFDRAIGAGDESACVGDRDTKTPQGGVFCPPVRVLLGGTGIDEPVPAALGFTLTGKCTGTGTIEGSVRP